MGKMEAGLMGQMEAGLKGKTEAGLMGNMEDFTAKFSELPTNCLTNLYFTSEVNVKCTPQILILN